METNKIKTLINMINNTKPYDEIIITKALEILYSYIGYPDNSLEQCDADDICSTMIERIMLHIDGKPLDYLTPKPTFNLPENYILFEDMIEHYNTTSMNYDITKNIYTQLSDNKCDINIGVKGNSTIYELDLSVLFHYYMQHIGLDVLSNKYKIDVEDVNEYLYNYILSIFKSNNAHTILPK